jgi:Cu-Zn family superoxide dismutase
MDAKTHYAICILREDNGSGVNGLVKFSQTEGGKTRVQATVKGLKAGLHGFHVHEFGNLTEGCKSAGGHYNPYKKDHAGPTDSERHVGDMGNITADGTNDATLDYEDAVIQLTGEYSIVGRSCVVHADEDDLGRGGHSDSKTTGHAGARLACGVIGLSGAF